MGQGIEVKRKKYFYNDFPQYVKCPVSVFEYGVRCISMCIEECVWVDVSDVNSPEQHEAGAR